MAVISPSPIISDGATPLKGRRVLVVDRHASTRVALRDMVISLGATSVAHAQTSGEVVRCVKSREVNLIICDYHLEDQRDGQQLLEELRHDKLVPLGTIFMMVTGERTYNKVVSVAEFAPDDYLIKPFTANQLLDRILKTSRKKEVFARAYAFIESGKAEAALPECRGILTRHPEYSTDAYRLMIDLLLSLKRHDEAEALLKAIVERKAVPWAFMGLANVHIAKQRLAEAETVLETVTETHPEYLGAQDLLAKVKEELDKPKEALDVLEAAGALSSANIRRLRRTGDLAAATGDHEKCARLYSRVLDRVRNSSMARAEDFMVLSNAYVQQGRFDLAEKVSTEQRRTMRGAPDAEIVSRLMEFQRIYRNGGSVGTARLAEVIEGAMQAFRQLTEPVSPALELDLLEACARAEFGDHAREVAKNLLERPDVPESIAARARARLAELEATKARVHAIVPLGQVMAMLGKLATNGWDDAIGDACQASIAHWEARDPAAADLPAARERLSEVMKKFGISSESFAAA